MLLKLLRFPLALLVIEALVLAIIATLYSTGAHRLGVPGEGPLNLIGALGFAGVIVLAHKALRCWVEGSSDTDFPRAGALRELGQGLILGFALFALAAGLVAMLGGLRIEGVRGLGQIWSLGAMAVTSAVFEEALFRGVLLRHIETMLGSWAALALTALLFGLAHLMNPHASLFAALAIAIEAGVMLGAAYLLTRRLWLAVGIHAAWNFTQGWVFSIPVSGSEPPLGLLVTRAVGADWLTGGGFGLEASVPALLVATGGGLVLLRRAIARGRLVPLPWRVVQTKL